MSLSEPDDPLPSGLWEFEDPVRGLVDDVGMEPVQLAHREAALEVLGEGLGRA